MSAATAAFARASVKYKLLPSLIFVVVSVTAPCFPFTLVTGAFGISIQVPLSAKTLPMIELGAGTTPLDFVLNTFNAD